MLDDSILLERCRGGDTLAWEALVRGYQGRVYAVARNYLRDPEEARDAAQEIFIKTYQQLGKFDGERFLPWLLSLARNCCIDRIRRLKVRTPPGAVPIEEQHSLADDGPTAEQSAEEAQRKRRLYRALDRLSDINREIILLKEIQGLKLEEVAELLGIPLGTAKSRSNRARLELAQQLQSDPAFGASA